MILICAAMKSEAAAIRAGVKKAGLESEFEILLTGMGLKNARRSLSERLGSGSKPSLVLSAGFAGSWDDGLAVGDWVCLGKLWSEDGAPFSGTFAPITFAKTSHLCSVSKIYPLPQSVCEKFRMDSALPISVDMETLAEAQISAEHGVPFQVLRYISDSPAQPLPHFLGDFVSFDIAETSTEKLMHLGSAVRNIVKNPAGVPQLIKAGIQWSRQLRDGWARFAPLLKT